MFRRTRTRVPSAGRGGLRHDGLHRSSFDGGGCASPFEFGPRGSVRLHHHQALRTIEQGRRAAFDRCRRIVKSDHHGYAARARQHCHVARRASVSKHDAAVPPVGREKHRGGEVGSKDDGSGSDPRRFRAGKIDQDPVADVGEIAGPGPEILILASLIAGDLGVEHPGPSLGGRHSPGDQPKSLFGQRGVFQHRDLESDHIGGITRQPQRQGPEIDQSFGDRLPESLGLFLRTSHLAFCFGRGQQDLQPAHREARSRRTTSDVQRRHASVLPELLRD